MRKIEMLPIEVDELLEFEDRCGVNTFLQELVTLQQENKQYIIYKIIDDNDSIVDYSIEEIENVK